MLFELCSGQKYGTEGWRLLQYPRRFGLLSKIPSFERLKSSNFCGNDLSNTKNCIYNINSLGKTWLNQEQILAVNWLASYFCNHVHHVPSPLLKQKYWKTAG